MSPDLTTEALRQVARHFERAFAGVGFRPADLSAGAAFALQERGWAVMRNGQLWLTEAGRARARALARGKGAA